MKAGHAPGSVAEKTVKQKSIQEKKWRQGREDENKSGYYSPQSQDSPLCKGSSFSGVAVPPAGL